MFPGKLHDLMSFVEKQGLESAISWVMNGRAFLIRDPEKLVELLPKFFSQTKYRSFRRQLNMWHFERVLDGPNRGAFHHPYFVRGNKSLCSYMSRHLFPPSDLTKDIDSKISGIIDSEDHSFFTISNSSHTEMENESQLSHINALSWIDSLKNMSCSSLDTETKKKAMLKRTDSIITSSHRGSDSPETIGSFQDGDLLSFAGRNFFFLDSINMSPCSTSPPPAKSLDMEYFDIDKVFDDISWENPTDIPRAEKTSPARSPNKVEFTYSNFSIVD